jgi:hypothetical protein
MLWTLITGLIVGAIAKFLTPVASLAAFNHDLHRHRRFNSGDFHLARGWLV